MIFDFIYIELSSSEVIINFNVISVIFFYNSDDFKDE
jgi:hypothetical protein